MQLLTKPPLFLVTVVVSKELFQTLDYLSLSRYFNPLTCTKQRCLCKHFACTNNLPKSFSTIIYKNIYKSEGLIQEYIFVWKIEKILSLRY